MEQVTFSIRLIKALGISCITDMALAESLECLDHSKVVETSNRSIGIIKELVLTM